MQYLEVAELYELVDLRQERPQRLWVLLCCNISSDCSGGQSCAGYTRNGIILTVVVLDLVPYTSIDVLRKILVYMSLT